MDPKHEQTTGESTRSSKRAKKQQDSNHQAEMKMHKAEEDVLNVIEGVESQLGALRKAHEDHRQAMKDLTKQKKVLAEETNELEQRETELTNREVELAEMRQEFETRELNLVQRAGGLEQRESKIASQAELLEQQEADLDTKNQTLEVKISELDSQLAGLSKRKAELNDLETQAKEKLAREDIASANLAKAMKELKAISQQVTELEQAKQGMTQELSDLKVAQKNALAELKESQAAHAESVKEYKAVVAKLRGREIELEQRSQTLEELAEKVGEVEAELSESRERFAQDIETAHSQLSQEKQVNELLRQEIDKLESLQEQSQQALSVEAKATKAQLSDALKEIDALKQSAQSLSQKGDVHDGVVAQLTQDLEAARSQVNELNGQMSEIAGSADEELTASRSKLTDLESKAQAKIDELNSKLAKVLADKEAIEQQLASKPDANPEQMQALESQLASAQEQSGSYEQELAQASKALETMEACIAKKDEEIAQAVAKAQEFENQSSELFETIKSLESQIEDVQANPGLDIDEWNTARRSRLDKMRKMLKGDAEKIRRATEALRDRYDQCEQVLTKRAELAEAYEVIASTQRKYQKREVRSGVFLGLISMAAISVMLAAASWLISGRVQPGMYAAKVTMAAASGDSGLSVADMEQWEVYITQLSTDPRFLEVAADRMKRRGISEYGVPGDLAKEMDASLDVVSAMPGTIVMEYRGEGAARTQRVLDTFAVALSSAANNARARRADSAVTIVEDAATAGDEPLDTRRLEMAGMIFGGSMLFTLIVGGVLWKRLSAAKARFESDSRMEGLLDDDRWEMPG